MSGSDDDESKRAVTESLSWELPSNSGREVCRWTVVASEGAGAERVYRCDVVLEGAFHEAILGGESGGSTDYSLAIRGLQVGVRELDRLNQWVREWLSLSLRELYERELELDCTMGSLFDQHLGLTLGRRDDTIHTVGQTVATLRYFVGRMRGELSYPVDPTCLRTLADGIERTLGEA